MYIAMAEDNVQQAISLLLPLIASTPNASGEGLSGTKLGPETPGLDGTSSQGGTVDGFFENISI